MFAGVSCRALVRFLLGLILSLSLLGVMKFDGTMTLVQAEEGARRMGGVKTVLPQAAFAKIAFATIRGASTLFQSQ